MHTGAHCTVPGLHGCTHLTALVLFALHSDFAFVFCCCVFYSFFVFDFILVLQKDFHRGWTHVPFYEINEFSKVRIIRGLLVMSKPSLVNDPLREDNQLLHRLLTVLTLTFVDNHHPLCVEQAVLTSKPLHRFFVKSKGEDRQVTHQARLNSDAGVRLITCLFVGLTLTSLEE